SRLVDGQRWRFDEQQGRYATGAGAGQQLSECAWRGDSVGDDPRADGVGGRYGDVSDAGPAGTGQRGADEPAGTDGRQLAMAVRERAGASGAGAEAAGDGRVV